MQFLQSLKIAFIVNYELKHTKVYLDSAAEVYMCYDRLLFSTYNKESSLPLYIADYTELKVLGKGMVTLDILIDGKLKFVNFCNILHVPELEYNLFFVGIIEKASYLILAKKGKMRVFDDKNNVAFEAIRIGISYLVNVLAGKGILVLTSLYLVPHNNA